MFGTVVGSSPTKPGGITPTIANGLSLRSTVLPTTAGSRPNARCQNASLTTAAAAPGVSSSGANVRPSAAPTPSVAK